MDGTMSGGPQYYSDRISEDLCCHESAGIVSVHTIHEDQHNVNQHPSKRSPQPTASGLQILILLPHTGQPTHLEVRKRLSSIMLRTGCTEDALLICSIRHVARLLDMIMALSKTTALT
jgi:hypothetical protein